MLNVVLRTKIPETFTVFNHRKLFLELGPPNTIFNFNQKSYIYVSKNCEIKNTDIHEGITHVCVNF